MKKNTRKKRKIKMGKIHICLNTKVITKFFKAVVSISLSRLIIAGKILTRNKNISQRKVQQMWRLSVKLSGL